MPYSSTADLPPAVRKLSPHLQDVFLAAFNAAYQQYKGDEETCFKVAWSAVDKARNRGADASESAEENIMAHDPAVYWNADEVNTLTALDAAEVRTDKHGKPYSWHPIVPVGEFYHPKFGKIAFTPDDVAEFAAHFRAGVRGSDIPVDEVGAHESTPGGAAYGWLEEVDVRPDGMWGKIGWNKSGQDALADDEYRYVSPTLHTRDLPFTARDGSKVGNVVKSICLTNRPVFKGQPALTVNMAEYTTEEAQPEPEGEVTNMSDSITKTPEEIAALEEERDAALQAAEQATAAATQAASDLQAAQDKIAAQEQALQAAEEQDKGEQTEAELRLAEADKRIQALEDERALKLAEDTYSEMELEGSRKLGKADVALYALVHRALPPELAAQFAEHVKGGGPTYIQFGEVGIGGNVAARKPEGVEKLRNDYEKAVEADPTMKLSEATEQALFEFAEGKEFKNFDALYAAWYAEDKPGLR